MSPLRQYARGSYYLVILLVTSWGPSWAQDSSDEGTRATESSKEEFPAGGIMGGAASEPSEEAPTAESAAAFEEPEAEAGRPARSLSQAERLRVVVDLTFTNANLKNVLSSLAKIYGLNIVAGEDVTGTVTLTLRGISLEEGLRQLLKLNGFGFTVREGIIEIIKLEEKRVPSLLYLKYLAPDTALELIQPLASENAVLKVDESNNAILVSDYLSKIEEMRNVLDVVDQAPQQVLIESRLIDITHTDLDEFDLDFSSIDATLPLHKSKGSSPPLIFTSGAAGMAASSSITADEFEFTIARGNDDMLVEIDALIQNSKVRVLATPSVLTLNNVEAKITIGEKFPIREQTQTSTGTLETTRFVDVGTTLRVTPKINRDGFIQMHIHPEVSSVSDATLDAGPRITTREADTTVLVGDGQPIVMAGLLSSDDSLIQRRIPLLGHLPFVGLLFQSREKDYEQKELVIIITPHIVEVAPKLREPTSPIQQVAKRLDASELFKEGEAMERSQSLKARYFPDQVRYLEAIRIYQELVDRFPTTPYAQEALMRIGRLARERQHDLILAEASFQRLITQFPGSGYVEQARRQLKSIRRELDRRQGPVVKVEAAPATPGFR